MINGRDTAARDVGIARASVWEEESSRVLVLDEASVADGLRIAREEDSADTSYDTPPMRK
jgi:hypothetical protein